MSGIPAGAGSLLGKQLGKFEILALLALGGTAEIYLARIGGAAGFEKYVVVKCLHDHLADDPEFVKMFLDEARLAAHLDHSNIVQTMELGEHENRYYMVMEFLAGLSLAMMVRRAGERLPGGRIPVPLVLNMMAQSCAGLHYAHEKAMNGKALNIVHRDISPQNLVVSFEGVVKVVDFGIAKAELRETKTRSGTIKGKFAYMSPEQCVATNVDRRTDVFALGVIAHELLTGRRLFKRNSPYETYQAVIDCVVDPPSRSNVELDPALDEVIMKAVAREKEERYPTAEAFGDALQRYLHSRGKGSGPGEVGRFFDATFSQEIEEHGARMRELIEGREAAPVEPGASWGGDEDKGATVDISRGKDDKSMSLDTGDLVEVERPSSHSLSEALDDLGAARDDDEIPADKTRIESNPLEKLAEFEAQQALAAKPKGASPTVSLHGTSQPPQAHKMPPSGPLPLPAPPTGPVQTGELPRASKDKFLANLPTMIADSQPEPPELASTILGGNLVDPQTGAPIGQPPMPVGHPPGQHPPGGQLGPTGYPVMNAQMSENIARGADIFPSERPSRQSFGPPPSGPYPPQPHDSGGYPMQGGPQHAANLMSPVGNQYPQQVDWAQAAAMPAKALPPWLMIALFVAAIVGALIITIIIAKIAR